MSIRLRVSLALAALALIQPGIVMAQPSGAQGDDFLYRTVRGDTLGDLARRYTTGHENWSTLQRLNNVEDEFQLPVSKLLRIPFSMIPERASTAVVQHVRGTARQGGAPLEPQAVLEEGQVVSTGPDGYVTLELADGSVLSVPPSSSLTFTRLREFQGTGLIDSIVQMRDGSLDSQVAPRNTGVGRFEVRTPVSVTGVRGTRLRVHVDDDGSRSEVVEGRAGVAGSQSQDQILRARQGVAVDSAGRSSGVRNLLTAPQLGEPVRAGGGWTVDFPPLEGARSYQVKVAMDADGGKVVAQQVVAGPPVSFSAPGAGTYHVFVRGVDDAGLGGLDAHKPFEGALTLLDASGQTVLSAGAGFVVLQTY